MRLVSGARVELSRLTERNSNHAGVTKGPTIMLLSVDLIFSDEYLPAC